MIRAPFCLRTPFRNEGSILGIFLSATLFLYSSVGLASPLKTVKHLDLNRFMGDWHVIGLIPNQIEKNCIDSVESYQLRSDKKIDVEFSCRKKDGSSTRLTATARVKNQETNASWRVRFNLFDSIPLPFSLAYEVIALDPVHYEYTVVAHPSRNYLWIMARSETLDSEVYNRLVLSAQKQGFDICKIKPIPGKVLQKRQ